MLPYYSIGGNALASTDSSFAETEINVVGDGSVSVGILANKTKGKKLNEKTGRYEGTATEGTYQTGDEIDYTVTVTNTGKSDLYNGKNGKGTDSSKNGANGKGKTSNGTKTGDNSPIGLLLAIMVVCAGTAVITVLFRRKER